MKVETKFDIGNEVYFVAQGKIQKGFISSVNIDIDCEPEYDFESKEFTIEEDSYVIVKNYCILSPNPKSFCMDVVVVEEHSIFNSMEELQSYCINLSIADYGV